LHEAHVRADLEQRFVDAAQVAGTVIKQGNHKVILATDETRKKHRFHGGLIGPAITGWFGR
jgi:hypothetical protein